MTRDPDEATRPVRPLEAIAGEIPENLRQADELLTNYGKWAMQYGGSSRPETLDRMYIRPRDFEAARKRREVREAIMLTADAMRVQRALTRVPDRERVVLTILYVRPWSAAAQLRRLQVPPRLSRDRHVTGLRMFWNIHGVLLLARDGA